MMVRIGTKAHPNRLSSFAILHGFLQLFTLTGSELAPAAFMIETHREINEGRPSLRSGTGRRIVEGPVFQLPGVWRHAMRRNASDRSPPRRSLC
jgi:hypothetical protein